MKKTLKITAVIAVFIVTALLIGSIVVGVRPDHETEEYLEKPTAVELFKKSERNESGQDQVSPLLQQAEQFANYLNPPPPPTQRQPRVNIQTPRTPAPPTPPRPAASSANFTLAGTSLSSNPSQSMALIDQPGKGLHWVRQGQEIGHLVVEEVNHGSITVKDGERIDEITVQRTSKRELITNILPAGSEMPAREPSFTIKSDTDPVATSQAVDSISQSYQRPHRRTRPQQPVQAAQPARNEEMTEEEKKRIEQSRQEVLKIMMESLAEREGNDENEALNSLAEILNSPLDPNETD